MRIHRPDGRSGRRRSAARSIVVLACLRAVNPVARFCWDRLPGSVLNRDVLGVLAVSSDCAASIDRRGTCGVGRRGRVRCSTGDRVPIPPLDEWRSVDSGAGERQRPEGFSGRLAWAAGSVSCPSVGGPRGQLSEDDCAVPDVVESNLVFTVESTRVMPLRLMLTV